MGGNYIMSALDSFRNPPLVNENLQITPQLSEPLFQGQNPDFIADYIYCNNINAQNSILINGVPPAAGVTIPLHQTLTFGPDNTYDIGTNGDFQPRNVYVAGTIQANIALVANVRMGGVNLYAGTAVPGTGIGNIGDFFFRSDTPTISLQRIYIKTAASVWTGIV